jgi:hypothetical protein
LRGHARSGDQEAGEDRQEQSFHSGAEVARKRRLGQYEI